MKSVDFRNTYDGIVKDSGAICTRVKALMDAVEALKVSEIKRVEEQECALVQDRKKFLDHVEQERAVLDKYCAEKRAKVEKEKQAWEDEKTALMSTYKFKNKIVKINAGGTLMSTRLSTLRCAGGMLDSLFSGRFVPDCDEDGNVFIDQNGAKFVQWVDLLRRVSNGEDVEIPESLVNLMKFLQPKHVRAKEETVYERDKNNRHRHIEKVKTTYTLVSTMEKE